MVYNKEELLQIFAASVGSTNVIDKVFVNLRGSDIKRSNYGAYYCPVCKNKHRNILLRIDNIWKCTDCAGSKSSGKKASAYRNMNINIIVNDLIDFAGGPITSEQIFDAEFVEGFVNFSGLDTTPNTYVLFVTLVKAVLAKEVGKLSILGYLDKSEAKLNKVTSPKVVSLPKPSAV